LKLTQVLLIFLLLLATAAAFSVPYVACVLAVDNVPSLAGVLALASVAGILAVKDVPALTPLASKLLLASPLHAVVLLAVKYCLSTFSGVPRLLTSVLLQEMFLGSLLLMASPLLLASLMLLPPFCFPATLTVAGLPNIDVHSCTQSCESRRQTISSISRPTFREI
jgi:hypothetical protein